MEARKNYDLFGNEIIEKINGSNKVFTCISASNHARERRQTEDFYATEPQAVQELLDIEKFSPTVLEPCVGMGHIAEVLVHNGYKVISQDIIDRDYPDTKIKDFLTQEENIHDIITNPPYVLAKEFAEHSLDISPDGTKVAMFLKLTFMESLSRKELFQKYPFKTLYVFSARRSCAKNGDFEMYPSSAVAYGWYVWEKGFKGDPVIKWI